MLIVFDILLNFSVLFFVFLALFSGWFFWPRKGGRALIKYQKKNTEKVLVEDALKFIFDCEYHKTNCDVNSIAGNINISADKAAKLVNRLLELDLVVLVDEKVMLTDLGRSDALRIVRTHRIWERYMADKTGIKPEEWHIQADRIEHEVSQEETEQIAAQMNHPVFDPHGDPIPTKEGVLPKVRGVGLNLLEQGDVAQIIHIEDEPKSIYEQILVLGLYPGMQIYVTSNGEHKITFLANGEQCKLTPLFAANITVEKITDAHILHEKPLLLSSLVIGEQAEVVGISRNCRGQQRRRLMDLGIVPGSVVKAVIKSASGDPVGYRVMGTTIGLRKMHADYVFVQNKAKIK